eukprot:TRINITY_DN16924_c0_g1_i1.p1 TRINITY_DN16924_c0_g1~~TRINITY_DN16924_c0_g1_i1.p1  ORF type:complete len:688 (-),score=124.24 TRINITY_DN16924_c0_g1_i1:132-2195(-)
MSAAVMPSQPRLGPWPCFLVPPRYLCLRSSNLKPFGAAVRKCTSKTRWIFPLWFLVHLVFSRLTVARGDPYDDQCEAIERHATMASRLYNQGRAQEGFAALDDARKSFKAAKKLNPKEPQAYISFALAMLNSMNFDEALKAWRGAKKRISDPSLFDWIDGRIRWTRFGKVSVQRDKMYSHGQGDLITSLSFMDKQLDIYPESPVLRHDKATTLSMVSELWGSNATAAAIELFAASQVATFEAWRAGLRERRRAGTSCETDGALIYDWPASLVTNESSALSTLETVLEEAETGYGPDAVFKDRGAYVASFDNIGLSGNDGIIVDEARCQIFMASGGFAINLHANLQLLEIWGDQPMPHGPKFQWYDKSRGKLPQNGQVESPVEVEKAASILQFADTSYFHLLTECFGRLWLLKRHGVLKDPELRFIAPALGTKKGSFLEAGLRILAPELVDSRMIWWAREGPKAVPDVRLRARTLFYADWKSPVPFGMDGGHCATPPSVIAGTRLTLSEALLPAASKIKPRALIFAVRRGKGNMRGHLHGEPALEKHLKNIAAEATPVLSFDKFTGNLSPAKTVALFARAKAVVGVHGGALVNIIFCPQDAELFEIGFATPFAGHYRHLARALGLHVSLLPLVTDNRGIAANEVTILDMAEAARVIRARLSHTVVENAESSSGGTSVERRMTEAGEEL